VEAGGCEKEEVMLYLSPNIKDSDVGSPPTLDDKIRLFEDRVIGWQLNPADCLRKSCGEHVGFAMLHILTSYFEMIAKYEAGHLRDRDSEKYFRLGVRAVFPNLNDLNSWPSNDQDDALGLMYQSLRCGLYHGGLTEDGIAVSWNLRTALEWNGHAVFVQPAHLALSIREHFKEFLKRLKNPTETTLRTNFEARFDWSGRAKP